MVNVSKIICFAYRASGGEWRHVSFLYVAAAVAAAAAEAWVA